MSVWNLLGFGTNWDRVNKMGERAYLSNIARIIHSITCLSAYENGMDGVANEFGAEKVYKIIKTFGKEIPTKTKYDKFKDYISISDLVPSARQVRKNERYQKYWDIAYKWAIEYEKIRIENIVAEKDKTIKELEEKNKILENKLLNEKIKSTGKENKEYNKASIENIIIALGGFDNLESVGNCATRLKVNVKNPSKVNLKLVKGDKELLAYGSNMVGKSVQIIYSDNASIVANQIDEMWSEKQNNKEINKNSKSVTSILYSNELEE